MLLLKIKTVALRVGEGMSLALVNSSRQGGAPRGLFKEMDLLLSLACPVFSFLLAYSTDFQNPNLNNELIIITVFTIYYPITAFMHYPLLSNYACTLGWVHMIDSPRDYTQNQCEGRVNTCQWLKSLR